ncbi:hypothetical protein HK101_010719 [Irineochytrium annulatum]|nr:hypothetical protein HK101_010719 [Irineochytrium annulatum]
MNWFGGGSSGGGGSAGSIFASPPPSAGGSSSARNSRISSDGMPDLDYGRMRNSLLGSGGTLSAGSRASGGSEAAADAEWLTIQRVRSSGSGSGVLDGNVGVNGGASAPVGWTRAAEDEMPALKAGPGSPTARLSKTGQDLTMMAPKRINTGPLPAARSYQPRPPQSLPIQPALPVNSRPKPTTQSRAEVANSPGPQRRSPSPPLPMHSHHNHQQSLATGGKWSLRPAVDVAQVDGTIVIQMPPRKQVSPTPSARRAGGSPAAAPGVVSGPKLRRRLTNSSLSSSVRDNYPPAQQSVSSRWRSNHASIYSVMPENEDWEDTDDEEEHHGDANDSSADTELEPRLSRSPGVDTLDDTELATNDAAHWRDTNIGTPSSVASTVEDTPPTVLTGLAAAASLRLRTPSPTPPPPTTFHTPSPTPPTRVGVLKSSSPALSPSSPPSAAYQPSLSQVIPAEVSPAPTPPSGRLPGRRPTMTKGRRRRSAARAQSDDYVASLLGQLDEALTVAMSAVAESSGAVASAAEPAANLKRSGSDSSSGSSAPPILRIRAPRPLPTPPMNHGSTVVRRTSTRPRQQHARPAGPEPKLSPSNTATPTESDSSASPASVEPSVAEEGISAAQQRPSARRILSVRRPGTPHRKVSLSKPTNPFRMNSTSKPGRGPKGPAGLGAGSVRETRTAGSPSSPSSSLRSPTPPPVVVPEAVTDVASRAPPLAGGRLGVTVLEGFENARLSFDPAALEAFVRGERMPSLDDDGEDDEEAGFAVGDLANGTQEEPTAAPMAALQPARLDPTGTEPDGRGVRGSVVRRLDGVLREAMMGLEFFEEEEEEEGGGRNGIPSYYGMLMDGDFADEDVEEDVAEGQADERQEADGEMAPLQALPRDRWTIVANQYIDEEDENEWEDEREHGAASPCQESFAPPPRRADPFGVMGTDATLTRGPADGVLDSYVLEWSPSLARGGATSEPATRGAQRRESVRLSIVLVRNEDELAGLDAGRFSIDESDDDDGLDDDFYDRADEIQFGLDGGRMSETFRQPDRRPSVQRKEHQQQQPTAGTAAFSSIGAVLAGRSDTVTSGTSSTGSYVFGGMVGEVSSPTSPFATSPRSPTMPSIDRGAGSRSVSLSPVQGGKGLTSRGNSSKRPLLSFFKRSVKKAMGGTGGVDARSGPASPVHVESEHIGEPAESAWTSPIGLGEGALSPRTEANGGNPDFEWAGTRTLEFSFLARSSLAGVSVTRLSSPDLDFGPLRCPAPVSSHLYTIMGGLLSALKPKRFGNRQVRILLLGLNGAGKTSILYQIKLHDVVDTIPTIGFNSETVRYKNLTLQMYDCGGQDSIRPLWRHYFAGCNGLVFVVDSKDAQRFDEARTELHKVLETPDMAGVPVVIIANKQDLPGAHPPDDLIRSLRLNSLNTKKWKVIPGCAKTGDGLQNALQWLSENMEVPEPERK